MNDSGVAEYDYTLTRLPGDQGWSLRLLCSGQLNPDTQLSRFSASAGGIPSLC